MKALENLLGTLLFEHGIQQWSHVSIRDHYCAEIEKLFHVPTHTGLHVQVWVIVGDGERPYVQTSAPSPERYTSLKAQGFRVYRTEVRIPEKVDDGVAAATPGERT